MLTGLLCLDVSCLLPSSAVYCIGNFGLMLLSLLETILVMHLMAKDAVTPDEDNGDQTQNKDSGTPGRFCFLNCQKGESERQLRLEMAEEYDLF